jgi:dTDP-4-dehydrorhamnose reductase
VTRVLVLGAAGMLGHKLLQHLSPVFDTVGTVRGDASARPKALESYQLRGGVAATDLPSVARALDEVKPHVVANCIGVVKQLEEAKHATHVIAINALFPHQVADLCGDRGVRLIHFSTDCVFSGKRGPSKEDDTPDAYDLYGRSKLLGEVDRPGALTIRTSIIGRELARQTGLLEWMISQRGRRIKGFANALYTGFPTATIADLVSRLIRDFPDLSGVWHVSSEGISKYDLLKVVNRVYQLGVEIDRDEDFHCDRRLDSSRFRAATGFAPASWERMIADMHADAPL